MNTKHQIKKIRGGNIDWFKGENFKIKHLKKKKNKNSKKKKSIKSETKTICGEIESPSTPAPNDSNGERADSHIDMDIFYVSFGASCTIVVLVIAAVLCINPYWRRAWFHPSKSALRLSTILCTSFPPAIPRCFRNALTTNLFELWF
jgi:hypothetical protein